MSIYQTCITIVSNFHHDRKKLAVSSLVLHIMYFEWFLELIQVCFWSHEDLKILTGKKHPKIKLQRSRKIRIWTFGSLVHQINSIKEVLKLKQIFQKDKVFTGKTPLFVIGPFCSSHSICLNIGFWYGSFVWKSCVFNLSAFNWKMVLQFFEKAFHFPENLFQS